MSEKKPVLPPPTPDDLPSAIRRLRDPIQRIGAWLEIRRYDAARAELRALPIQTTFSLSLASSKQRGTRALCVGDLVLTILPIAGVPSSDATGYISLACGKGASYRWSPKQRTEFLATALDCIVRTPHALCIPPAEEQSLSVLWSIVRCLERSPDRLLCSELPLRVLAALPSRHALTEIEHVLRSELDQDVPEDEEADPTLLPYVEALRRYGMADPEIASLLVQHLRRTISDTTREGGELLVDLELLTDALVHLGAPLDALGADLRTYALNYLVAIAIEVPDLVGPRLRAVARAYWPIASVTDAATLLADRTFTPVLLQQLSHAYYAEVLELVGQLFNLPPGEALAAVRALLAPAFDRAMDEGRYEEAAALAMAATRAGQGDCIDPAAGARAVELTLQLGLQSGLLQLVETEVA